MNSRTWRRYALYGSLALAIVLSAVSGIGGNTGDEPPVRPRSQPAQASRAPAQPLPNIELEPLQPRDAPPDTGELASNNFRAKSWYVAPPAAPPKPAAIPLPPPAPTAPPMPFTFLGRYEEGGVRIIMLVKADRIYTVSEGDVIDQTYRLDRLAGGQLELTYLPLDIKQTISAGGT
jgi:hypothetical protein